MNRIYSIGLWLPDIGALADELKQHKVAIVVDVRSAPVSSWQTDFNSSTLEPDLPKYGLGYQYLGKQLGGRSYDDPSCYDDDGKVSYTRLMNTTQFVSGIEKVLDIHKLCSLALLCSCRDPLKCHRGILIARYFLEVKHVELHHIIHPNDVIRSSPEPHTESEIHRFKQDFGFFFPDNPRHPSGTATEELKQAYSIREQEFAYRHRSADHFK